jgi:short-subunit dehydrogenase involved in D-alanine esterification of teichoic acids
MSKTINKTVLITGASSGIGEAFAQVFSEQGFDAVMKGKCLLINGRLNNFFAILSKLIPQNLTRSIAKYLTQRSY